MVVIIRYVIPPRKRAIVLHAQVGINNPEVRIRTSIVDAKHVVYSTADADRSAGLRANQLVRSNATRGWEKKKLVKLARWLISKLLRLRSFFFKNKD